MTVVMTCDFCGQPIVPGELYAAISCVPSSKHRQLTVAHYHDTWETPCHGRFLELLALVREQAGNLAAIPVAKQAEIDAARAAHTGSAMADARERFRMLGLSARATNGLVNAGILNLNDATCRSDATLLAIDGVGRQAVEMLREAWHDQARERARRAIEEGRTSGFLDEDAYNRADEALRETGH